MNVELQTDDDIRTTRRIFIRRTWELNNLLCLKASAQRHLSKWSIHL